MNQAIKTNTYPLTAIQPQWPIRDRLLKIRIKDYNLLAIRDRSIETTSSGQALSTRFYSIVSQNRKIAFTESLSTSTKVFLNFESFKWSEMYFQFFKSITHSADHRMVFSEIIYKIENKLGLYYSIIFNTHSSLAKVFCPITRINKQTQLLAEIQQHTQGKSLFTLYLYDLVMIALRHSRRSLCSSFISPTEAQLLLGHFCAQGLIQISDDKLKYHSENITQTLRELIANNGRMIITGFPKNQITHEQVSIWREIFEARLPNIEKEVFESSFVHT